MPDRSRLLAGIDTERLRVDSRFFGILPLNESNVVVVVVGAGAAAGAAFATALVAVVHVIGALVARLVTVGSVLTVVCVFLDPFDVRPVGGGKEADTGQGDEASDNGLGGQECSKRGHYEETGVCTLAVMVLVVAPLPATEEMGDKRGRKGKSGKRRGVEEWRKEKKRKKEKKAKKAEKSLSFSSVDTARCVGALNEACSPS